MSKSPFTMRTLDPVKYDELTAAVAQLLVIGYVLPVLKVVPAPPPFKAYDAVSAYEAEGNEAVVALDPEKINTEFGPLLIISWVSPGPAILLTRCESAG